MSKQNESQIALVTGVSHSRGIGAAICKHLAMEGKDIFFSFWEAAPEWPQTFQKEILSLGVRCGFMELDLSLPDAHTRLLDRVTTSLGFPTIVVNNAAYSTRDGFAKLEGEELDRHYKVNMRATFLLSVEWARRFESLKRNWGRLINLTSGQGLGPMPGELAYAATKGAISAFTQSLSAELAPLGITVNAVNPGPTDTGWMTEEIKPLLEAKFPSGRVGVPQDATRLIAFLSRDEAFWITGQILNSEGGFLRG